MHETGLIRKLIETARTEAARRGGHLRGIDVRLGALAGGTAEHLRDHFEREIEALGLGAIELSVAEVPEHPAGVELVGISLVEPRAEADADAEDTG